MKIVIIGRTQMLYNTALSLLEREHSIPVVVTSMAAPEYTKTERDFERLASDIKAKFFLTNTLDVEELLDSISGLDIGISVNWISIVQQRHIECFRLGILNAHAGDLPRYRGNACSNWAIINGEKEVVLSIHLMEGGLLDCGRLIIQDRFPITDETYIGDVYDWLEKVVPRLFLRAIELLAKDPNYTLKYADPESPESFRCYPRLPEDSRIDWSKSAIDIHRLIRASSEPFAGAYTFLDEKKLTIWRAELVKDNENYLAVPGQVSRLNKDGSVDIITGEGKLRLKTVSVGDGAKITPRDVIRSIRIRLK